MIFLFLKLIFALIEISADVLNPIQPEAMDTGKLKSKFWDKICFWAGRAPRKSFPREPREK